MENRIHYLYRHIRLDKDEPFYIGIGTVYKQDLNSNNIKLYYKRAYSVQNKNKIWNRIIGKSNYEVEIIIESNDYTFIKSKEIEFIKLYGRLDLKLGILANLTDGGDGSVGLKRSFEFKESCKKRMTGYNPSESTRRKMSEAHSKRLDNKCKIIDIDNGIIYSSVVEAAKNYKINLSTLHNYLNGRTKNKTSLNLYKEII